MVPFSSSPQIHLPGQLLTPPANSQDEDLVTLASNRSRFIDMWCWLSFSGAAVHRINFNCSLMFSPALQILKCLQLHGFLGEVSFYQEQKPELSLIRLIRLIGISPFFSKRAEPQQTSCQNPFSSHFL